MRTFQLVATILYSATALSASQVMVIPYVFTALGCNTSAAGAAQISCYADNGAFFGGTGTFQGYSYAQGGQTLHGKAVVTTSAFGGSSYAYPDLLDSLSLSSTTATGFVRFQYKIDGTLNVTSPNSFNSLARAGFQIISNNVTLQGPLEDLVTGFRAVSQTGIIDVPYTSASLTFDARLLVQATCQNNNNTGPTVQCSATSDFYNTGLITGMGVFDSSGAYRPNAVVSSSSGLQYPALSSAPEPKSVILLGTGMCIFLARRLKRRFRMNSHRF